MSLMTNVYYTAMDSEGRALPYAKLYTYEVDSSTPKDTYSDIALNTPNANPIIADGAGRFFNVYLATDGTGYKMVVTDRYDTVIATQDDFYGAASASTQTTQFQAYNLSEQTGIAEDWVVLQFTDVERSVGSITIDSDTDIIFGDTGDYIVDVQVYDKVTPDYYQTRTALIIEKYSGGVWTAISYACNASGTSLTWNAYDSIPALMVSMTAAEKIRVKFLVVNVDFNPHYARISIRSI